MALTVFGKLPSHADFFRTGALNPVVHEAERWLTDAYEGLRGAGLNFPRSPIYFILGSSAWREVVIAIGVGSTDSVGRSFPLVAFATIDAQSVGGRGWVIPVLYDRFFKELESVLNRASTSGDEQALNAELALIQELDSSLFVHSESVFNKLSQSQTVQAFEERVFQKLEQRYYSYRTIRMACDQVRATNPEQATIVLGCPVGIDIDVVAWSAMASRILGWQRVLPMIWAKLPEPRLVVSLGPPPAQALRFLIEPKTESMKFWPLTTFHQEALQSARDAIGPLASWDQTNEPLAGLFERVATFG